MNPIEELRRYFSDGSGDYASMQTTPSEDGGYWLLDVTTWELTVRLRWREGEEIGITLTTRKTPEEWVWETRSAVERAFARACELLNPDAGKPRPFTRVELLKMYPPQSVADHEVFLTFHGDSDAVAWEEWWHSEGAMAFAGWLEGKEERERQAIEDLKKGAGDG